jgi:hypothetical protein
MADIPAYLYVAKFYVDGALSTIHFHSMGEMCGWAEFHNMVLGHPTRNAAIFSVTHTDGTPLSEEERSIIATTASRENFRARQSEAIAMIDPAQPGGSGIANSPEDGVVNAIMCEQAPSQRGR